MGASTGIGRALAINYADKEVVLGLASRRIDLLETIKEECKLLNYKIFIYKTDVRNKSECEQSAKKFIEVAGGIDILIANSVVGSSDDIFSGTSEKINKVLEGRPHIVDLMKNKEINLVFNTTEGRESILDSASIRRTALDQRICSSTTIDGARAICKVIENQVDWKVKKLQDIH